MIFLTMTVVIQVGRVGEIDIVFVLFTTAALGSFEFGRRRVSRRSSMNAHRWSATALLETAERWATTSPTACGRPVQRTAPSNTPYFLVTETEGEGAPEANPLLNLWRYGLWRIEPSAAAELP